MSTVDDACRAAMRVDAERFLGILKVELEHLIHEVELMACDYSEKKGRHEVTEHVCGENVAVLENEEYGWRHFIAICNEIDAAAYDSLDALIEDLSQRFKSVIEHRGLAPAAYVLACRKVNKVARYVRQSA